MQFRIEPVRNVTPNRAAIVFIHGFGGDTIETWQKFPELLRDEPRLKGWDIYLLGYATALRIDLVSLWSGDPDLTDVALRIRTDAKISVLARYDSLCLIAHSMGGLATQRALLDDRELRERISHVFLFGTPSGGLVKASLVRFLKPQLRDMAHDSKFIRTLRTEWDAEFSVTAGGSLPFHFFAVGGERDQFVPYESSLAPFPPNAFPNVQFVVPGNHLEIVKPTDASSQSIQCVVKGILGDAAPAGPWNAARVAIEAREYRKAVRLLEPHKDELDDVALAQLALCLEGVGRQADAVELLIRQDRSDTDAMGVLAGRFKRRWLLTRRKADAESARDLYGKAYSAAKAARDAEQAYYNGINLAFLQLAYEQDTVATRKTAKAVLVHCNKAKLHREKPKDKMWRLATEGEAKLYLGNIAMALDHYRAAVDCNPEPREMQSMYQQALYIVRLLDDRAVADALAEIFRGGKS